MHYYMYMIYCLIISNTEKTYNNKIFKYDILHISNVIVFIKSMHSKV